jgi:hypothetical protein
MEKKENYLHVINWLAMTVRSLQAYANKGNRHIWDDSLIGCN